MERQSSRKSAANNMELVQTYASQVIKDTSSAERLALSKVFLGEVSQQLDGGAQYDGDTLAEIVRVLPRVNLDTAYTTPKLRDFLLSQEFRDVMRKLTSGLGNASDILRGMTWALSAKGVGFDRLINWSAALVNAWITRPDSTVAPTSPGFMLELLTFIFMCRDRQNDICGDRNANISTMDNHLLPLVAGALTTETKESINMGDTKNGNTALHRAAGVNRLPEVTRALLVHPDIDVNVRNIKGQTPLTRLTGGYDSLSDTHLPVARVLLAHSGINVSVIDDMNKTVLDHCLGFLGDSHESCTVALELISMICQHTTMTPDMITTGLERLLDWKAPDSLHCMCNDIIVNLSQNSHFDINRSLRGGKTVCHLAASQGHHIIVEKIMNMIRYDPKIADNLGNTVLYYACANLPPESALEVIDHPTLTWDFTHKNKADQTILDYYHRLPERKRDPMVLGILEKRMDRFTSVYDGRRSAFPDNTLRYPRPTEDRPVREIQWTTYVPEHGRAEQVNVLPTTQDFVNTKLDGIAQNKIFRMTSAKKGKACIICVHRFLVPALGELNGYNVDSRMLAELWFQMGYEVMVPKCAGVWQLTAEEIQKAVREFSEQLTQDDPCVVVCLLSHGGQGYIYGSDGKTASLKELLDHLDNEKCPQMRKKPKVAIVQACAGNDTDFGVAAGPSSGPSLAYSAANEPPLPTLSDLIICSPALPGYVSYVRPRGSVFITHLVEIFARHAKEDDIGHLMTWVNHAVSEEDIAVLDRTDDCKQMSHTESCLTKLLYFFPCPRGGGGRDWTAGSVTY